MINSNFGFTPLKEVWIGDCYPSSWYDHLSNEIADPFRQITEWTKEDTEKLQKFLESRGIVVRRPKFESIDDHVDNYDNLIKPPVTPRDHYVVLDKTLYSLHNNLKKDPWRHSLDLYSSAGFDVQYPVNQPINCLCPPALVRMGQDLFIDKDTHPHVWGFICQWMIETSTNYRVNICQTSGHSDGVFCPVAPGTIVSSHYKSDYSQSFPGWEVFQIPKQITDYDHAYKRGSAEWHTPSTTINQNKTFSDYIFKNANSWVGNFKETVYEVNMLVIDEHNVIAMQEYPPLTEWLYKRGINVHCFDLRTRTFWDGGWHCFTLDINRDDSKTNLFSSDLQTGIQWKLN
jgi:N-dimethylarginine dimethylaminohydrolase